MPSIRAAVCRDTAADLTIETVELRLPRGGEVEVTLSACAICHSDISLARGAWSTPLPAVFGHEAAGRVTATGPEVTAVAEGDPVIVTLIRACGVCPSCQAGSHVTCETPPGDEGRLHTGDGGTLNQGLASGAFAERVVVDASQIAPIPGSMPMEAASLLSCGVITGVGAVVNTGRVRPGESVVVVGAGGVGLNAIQGARIAGAGRILAIDTNPDKLADARAFGATDVITAAADTADRVTAITGRGADAVFVTAGAGAAYESAPRYLAPTGRLVMVGMPPDAETVRYAPADLAAARQSLVGSKMGDVILARDIPWMVDLYQQGRLELDALISARWRLDEINAAIADTLAGGARRNVLVFE